MTTYPIERGKRYIRIGSQLFEEYAETTPPEDTTCSVSWSYGWRPVQPVDQEINEEEARG